MKATVQSFPPCDLDTFPKLLNESLQVRYNRSHAEVSRITNTFSGVMWFLATGANTRNGRPEEKLRTWNKSRVFIYWFFVVVFCWI